MPNNEKPYFCRESFPDPFLFQSPLVTIEIVTWNRKEKLYRCIESAVSQKYPNFNILVIDNASTDNTSEMVAREFPCVSLVHAGRNRGCPSARNLGFSHCRGKYIYMLDDDGWLDPDAVAYAVSRAESDAAIGVVMSRVHELEEGKIVRGRLDYFQQFVFLSSFGGGCSLIRREVLEKVGAFPDDFFGQAEESDLALRMLDAGYFCCLEPASVMYHAPSPDGRNKKTAVFYALRNSNCTGLRHWPFPWCVLRPLVNFYHAFRFMITMRYPRLPLEIIYTLAADLFHLHYLRQPVTYRAWSLYRRLQRFPSCIRPE